MKLVLSDLIGARQGNWFELVGTARPAFAPYLDLQLDHLRRVDVFARTNFGQQPFIRRGIQI